MPHESALEPYRPYLAALARLHLDPRLRGKLDPADVVQQVMLRAAAAFPGLRRREPPVIAAWLRRILARTLADTVRHYEADKRDVGLERSLTADLDRSACGLAGWAAADQTSPSGGAARQEELTRLAEALADLPEPHRTVVVGKHLQGRTLAELAASTGRSLPRVAGLLRRGLAMLRERLRP